MNRSRQPVFSRRSQRRRLAALLLFPIFIACFSLTVGFGGSDPSACGASDLFAAVEDNEPDTLACLLEHGANPNHPNPYGVTPLMLACILGNTECVERLVQSGADVHSTTDHGESPILFASRTGVPAVLETLIRAGADPNASESWKGQTALMWAAAEGHTEAVRLLADAGANLNTRSRAGFTAYLFAVRQGHQEVVDTLLELGVRVDQALPDGPTAMGLAVLNAHFEMAAGLLEAGADPNYAWDGRTALHVITWVRRPGQGTNDPAPPGSGSLDSLELVRHLVAHGADINARMSTRRAGVRTTLNFQRATPFLLAARTADLPLLRLLAELGADPHLANADGTTPLLVAAGVGVQSPGEDPGTPDEVFDAVRFILELGADVNAVDDNGETAMHGAAYKYAASTVPLLADHGADFAVWNRKNRKGWTPLRIAVGVHRTMNLRSSPETAEAIRRLLIAHGASTEVEPETNISGATN